MSTKSVSVPYNFAGLDDDCSSWETSRVAVIPVPYDLTTTYQTGTRKGPQAVIEASTHMELFDDELHGDVSMIGIHTCDQVEQVTTGPDAMVARVAEVVSRVVDAGKFPVVLGGEHTVTLGAVQAMKKKHAHIGVVQFDAHADLRNTYQGSHYNHACVGRRLNELGKLTQIGTRSLCSEEYDFLASSNIHSFFAKDILQDTAWIEKCIEILPSPIYITIDVDVFDPSIMPSVGTPEPGGLGWYEILHVLRSITAKKQIIGFDIVELCPQPSNHAPDFLAAKLCYKMLGYILLHTS